MGRRRKEMKLQPTLTFVVLCAKEENYLKMWFFIAENDSNEVKVLLLYTVCVVGNHQNINLRKKRVGKEHRPSVPNI